MARAPCCEKVGLKKGRWTRDEDEILINYIQANGEGSWRSLPKNAGLLRCGKSCRLRWINYLRADLKRGNISTREEDVIIRLHASLGNRWSLIASQLPGRTDNEIKNYWNSHLSRRIDTFRRAASTSDTTPMITDIHIPEVTSDNVPPKRKDGKKSHRAVKKNKKTEKPKASSVSLIDENEKEEVPVPSTPALENEILPTAMEDFLALEADQVDKSEARVVTCYQDSDQGIRSSGCSSECREGLRLELVEIPEEPEDIDGGGVFCFNDLFDPRWLLDGGGVSNINDERDSNVNSEEVVGVGSKPKESDIGRVESCPGKMAASEELGSVNLSSDIEKRESTGEWFSSSSITTSVFDDNWDVDWESSILQLENESRDESYWADNEKLISWLWEDDNDWESVSQNLGGIDPERHNAKVAWFLS